MGKAPVSFIDKVGEAEAINGNVFAILPSYGAEIRLRLEPGTAILLGRFLQNAGHEAIVQRQHSCEVIEFPGRRAA